MFTLIIVVVVVATLVSFWYLASRPFACPVWLRWFVEIDNPFSRNSRATTIVEHLDLKPGMTVLDLGCGPGRVSIPAARKTGPDGKIVAVDIQPGMLARAKARAQAAGLTNIEFLLAGAGENKLGNNRFDRALLVTVLGEIPDRPAAMNEIFEALKPGGVLSVTEILVDPHFQNRKKVTALARDAGFKECGFFGNRFSFTLNLGKPQ